MNFTFLKYFSLSNKWGLLVAVTSFLVLNSFWKKVEAISPMAPVMCSAEVTGSDWDRRQMSVWEIVSLSPAIVSVCYYWPWAGDSISLEGRQSTVCTITCVTHYTRVTHYMLHQCFTLHQCPSCRYKGRSIKTSNCRWLSGYTTGTMKEISLRSVQFILCRWYSDFYFPS